MSDKDDLRVTFGVTRPPKDDFHAFGVGVKPAPKPSAQPTSAPRNEAAADK